MTSTPLRSRRQTGPSSTSKEVENEPLIVVIDDSSRNDPAGKKKKSSWVTTCCYMIVTSMVVGAVGLLTASPDAMSTGKALLSGCGITDCTLPMVTLMQNGTVHPCKDFCAAKLVWKDSAIDDSPDKLYGSFEQHGMCKLQPELGLKRGGGLVPRLGSSSIPDFTSLMLHGNLKGKRILLVGDSLMKQNLDVLPMVLSGYKEEVKHYEYTSSGVSGVHQCGNDFPTKSQSCRSLDKEKKERYACNCTSVTTISVQSTKIQIAWAYGVEYQKDSKTKGYYGLEFNMVRPALLRMLLKDANALVMNMGVLANDLKHDLDGHSAFLEWVRTMGATSKKFRQRIMYRLTMPQHFPTKNPSRPYQDEERATGSCIKVAKERHWTDTMAQSILTGDVDVIDMFPIASTQGMYHSNNPGDCNQWCLGYDLFYAFWSAVEAAL